MSKSIKDETLEVFQNRLCAAVDERRIGER